MSNYPLYWASAEAAKQVSRGNTPTANTGLWFTRFYSGFGPDWDVEKEHKRDWIDTTVGMGKSGNAEQVSDLLQRQRKLCTALGGQVVCLETVGNFVTGTGLNHPVENGFTFHPTLGMPYLPASGVKGLLRGWVEVWMDHGAQSADALVTRWFGSAKGADTPGDSHDSAGGYLFFDALPSKPVQLGCDVMTPHMGKWYEKGGEYTSAMQADVAPADWHSPVPVPFLVVKPGTEFNFMVAPRLTGNPQIDTITRSELPRVLSELQNALEWLGAGAKTAAGYGRMVDIKAQDEQQIAQNLAESGIQTGEEVWEKATLVWEKGSQKLHAESAGKTKTSPWTGDAAKNWVNARSKSEVKKLDDRKLVRTVRVRIQGNQVTLIAIADPVT